VRTHSGQRDPDVRGLFQELTGQRRVARSARQIADIEEFKRANQQARVVVVNVAFTEPPLPDA
jgi:hypothetical protein